ncbi:MAG: short-chain dehydrogenase [Rhizobiales bacterium PAR1]|nr:MAG: short-chain dehydrogenase [Rhizobiales bacterium PAR1]
MRNVLVTGAIGGLGQAICTLFAEAGDRVIVVDRDDAQCRAFAATLGAAHAGIGADLSREDEIIRLVREAEQAHGPVDVLINNAAIGPTMTATADMSLEAIRQTFAVNLTAPFLLTREIAKGMTQRGGGVIVNTASLAGIVPNPKRNAYAASKAALINLTKALALEWAHNGIRVNALAPGYIRTPMVAELEAKKLVDLALVRRRIPMGRIGRPDEMAQGIYFLASPQARYMTGAVLVVDGGWQAFNAAGDASSAAGVPGAELSRPASTTHRRTALVTGAARGIGEATARLLAQQGWRLVGVDADSGIEETVSSLPGDGHRTFQADIRSESEIQQVFAKLAAQGIVLDAAINNAAIADTFMPSIEQTREAFEKVVEVNVIGTMLCAREAVRHMTPQGYGVIVNFASITAHTPFPPRNAYSASKAAIINLTGCMAGELASAGLRVVAVAPGYIATAGVKALEQGGKIDLTSIRQRIPMGALGEPEDIAAVIAFLISDRASYITGSTVFVDGGWTAFGGTGAAFQGELPEPQ